MFSRKIFYVVIFVVIASCTSETNISNPNGLFSEVELSELNQMVDAFDHILVQGFDTKSEFDAYMKFSEIVEEEISLTLPIGMEALGIEVMNYKVFSKIWRHYEVDSRNKEKYNIFGTSDYIKYLKRLGEDSDFLQVYAQSLEDAGDISPALIAGFAVNIELLDLTDRNNRLVFAIHYLTLIQR
jgi:hypothetical protein